MKQKEQVQNEKDDLKEEIKEVTKDDNPLNKRQRSYGKQESCTLDLAIVQIKAIFNSQVPGAQIDCQYNKKLDDELLFFRKTLSGQTKTPQVDP